jgi:hypothetical protein
MSTREQWLIDAVEELRPLFTDAGFPISSKIRVSCAFPTTYTRSGALGQAFPDGASADRALEVMVAPSLDQPRDVFAVLVSQLCHATNGALSHATVAYQHAAAAMHLEPAGANWRVTRPVPLAFEAAFGNIIDALGPYPHAALSAERPKTQSTRMLKATCPSCGYIVRVSNKWAAKGLPVCGIDGDTFNITEEAGQ